MIVASAHGPSALWYATRGAGAVTLVLLTMSTVFGIGQVRSWRPAGAPRFTVAALHRTISLLALTFLVAHIVTVLLDPFPPIGVLTAVVPFATSYRQLWMGLGTLAADILFALIITSLVRRRLRYKAWRGVHWAAYACWPIAVLHGLGTGSDTKSTWMLLLTLACAGAVVVAVIARLGTAGTAPAARMGGAAAITASALGLAIWLPQGPLAKGWAKRAGTPASVLNAFAPPRVRTQTRVVSRSVAPTDPLYRSFTSDLAGQIRNGVSSQGTAVVDLSMRLSGDATGVLRIRLGGVALPDGGLQMQQSAITLGPPNDPARYAGRISFLQGDQLRALVGSSTGKALRLTVNLSLGQDSVTGSVQGRPVTKAGA